MKQYRNSDAGIRCLSIICPDGLAVTYDFETDSSLNTIWNNYSDMRQAPPYCEAVDAPGMVLSDTMRFEEGENPGHFFHISKDCLTLMIWKKEVLLLLLCRWIRVY